MVKISYGKQLDELISKIEKVLQKDEELSMKYPTRWLAIKLLERDKEALEIMDKSSCKHEVVNQLLGTVG